MDSLKTYLNSGYSWTNSKIRRLPVNDLSSVTNRYTDVFSDIASSTLPLRLLAALAATIGLYLHQIEPSLWTAVLLSFIYFSYAAYAWLLTNYLLPILSSHAMYGAVLVDAAISVGLLALLAGPAGLLASVFLLYLIYLYLSSAHNTVLEYLDETEDVEDIAEDDADTPIRSGDRSSAFGMSQVAGGNVETQVVDVQKWKEDRNTKVLLDVAKKLSSTLDLGLVLHHIAESASVVTGLSKCVVMLKDNAGYLVGKAANVGPEELNIKTLEELVEVPSRRSLAHKVWSARSPVDINNQNSMGVPREDSPLHASGSILAIPLLHGEEPLGVIYGFDGVKRVFTEAEKEVARQFGELSAQAIKNARTYEEAQSKMNKLGGDLTSAVRQLEQVRESRRRNVISVSGLSIDATSQRVTLMEQPVELSPTEFRLLYALAERAGSSVSQDILFEKAWGEAPTGQTNVVDVYIHRLRKKVEEDASSPKRVITVRGEGYKLC